MHVRAFTDALGHQLRVSRITCAAQGPRSCLGADAVSHHGIRRPRGGVEMGEYRACSAEPSRGRFMEETYHIASVLAALGHKLRLEVWCLLVPCGSHGLSAGSIAAQLAVPASTLLFHLQRMTEAGILWQRHSSHQTIYGVNRDVVDRSCDFIKGRSWGRRSDQLPHPSTEDADNILG
jgi:hypothetical protein